MTGINDRNFSSKIKDWESETKAFPNPSTARTSSSGDHLSYWGRWAGQCGKACSVQRPCYTSSVHKQRISIWHYEWALKAWAWWHNFVMTLNDILGWNTSLTYRTRFFNPMWCKVNLKPLEIAPGEFPFHIGESLPVQSLTPPPPEQYNRISPTKSNPWSFCASECFGIDVEWLNLVSTNEKATLLFQYEY